ncbi:MAG TPA: sigma-70 family RNA polymerase sigma factor [Candidatus Eisenbacteria bacterium]|nr:sigma-70 family RNA polymerase sigma factor [Candidatus Eisenbacteria bacterium]
MEDRAAGSPDGAAPHETTAVLIAKARSGDTPAGQRLLARLLPALRRWARHRFPARLRDARDTDDLVQDVLLRAFRRIDSFENRGEGAFLAYLRQILLNAVKDEARRADRAPRALPLDDNLPDLAPSAVERAIGADQLRRFEDALATLPEEQQQAVILRVEFGYTHAQIAEALGKPSMDAARVMVSRALAELARRIDEG